MGLSLLPNDTTSGSPVAESSWIVMEKHRQYVGEYGSAPTTIAVFPMVGRPRRRVRRSGAIHEHDGCGRSA